MSHRNTVWTHQVVNNELEGQCQIRPGSFYYGSTGSDSSNLGLQVATGIPGHTANVGIQQFLNPCPRAGVTSSFVYPTAIYNPSMSTTAMNICIPQTQSFGLGNQQAPSLYQQVATRTMVEGSSSGDVGGSASGFIKRKNAVVAGDRQFLHGFASSSSSAHMPQNPVHMPWNASFQSSCLPNSAASNPPEYHNSNCWPFLGGSSSDEPNSFSSIAAHTESVCHGNYAFPSCHIGQRNTWIAPAANAIAHRVPQWGYSNAVANPLGTIDMPNGNLQDYQAGHSIHGPISHFVQNPLLQGPHMQVPHQPLLSNNVVHGGNLATMVPLDPRVLALPFNSGHTFGHPVHPLLTNQVNNGVLRNMPYQKHNAMVMDRSRIYESVNVIDEHRDMRLDVDSMSYEELVALEEQIGDVNTGLTESYIEENLKSSLYVPGAACMSDRSSELSTENDACIICQEEYKAKELIGTLECGHKHHLMCIKQWLTMKNLCPICKTTALSADRRNG
ncbi:hypothetical protein ACP70R_035834 [Stipagrostis hirtigluma subsp. patula]